MFTVKRNQPSLHGKLKTNSKPCLGRAYPSRTKHPVANTGREEKLLLNVVTVAVGIMFDHARQTIQVTRKNLRAEQQKVDH